jgi:hypothetical protein
LQPLRLHLGFLPQLSLSQNNTQSISHSLHYFNSCVSCYFSAASFLCDRMQRNAPRAGTLSASKLLMLSFGWWHRYGGTLCWFGICALQKWGKVHFRSTEHCTWCWLCCWVRCWTLQVMDNMEASCGLYDKVGTFTHLEQCKMSPLTVNRSGRVC